jgi:energy-coupling factor transporter ATP-binding protein EcfA2
MLELQGVSYRYPGSQLASVKPTTLSLPKGQIALLTGPTGCGKSTLLRVAAGLLQRHGRGEHLGHVRVDGKNPAKVPPSERVGLLGFVSQEPSDQIVASTIGDEIAFGLESAGWSSQEIRRRVHHQLESFELPTEPLRSALALSGGQRQRLVTAAALAARPSLLLLDEPISQLDPAAALRLLALLREVADTGVTILLVEHRIETCLPFIDRVLVMNDGEIVHDALEDEVDLKALQSLGLQVPALRLIKERFSTLRDAAKELRQSPTSIGTSSRPMSVDGPALQSRVKPDDAPTVRVQLTEFQHRYSESDDLALGPLDLHLHRGERVALLGGNGAGKSTLLAAIAGDLGSSGRSVFGRVVDVPQDPDLTLFCPTVLEELTYGPREAQLNSPEEEKRRAHDAAVKLSIADLLDRPPQSLSRGQRLRCAVAAALSCRPDVLLLDEPTSGQDTAQVERMMAGLSDGGHDQRLLVFATHDVELALRHADRVIILEAGRITADGAPNSVLPLIHKSTSLVLPPLAAWCREEGLPFRSLDDLLQPRETS